MHETLWDEHRTRERLGADGYQWFLDRAERHIAACPDCKGSGEVLIPNDLLNRGQKETVHMVGRRCPACLRYTWGLNDFVHCYYHDVPPVYRGCILSQLQPYGGTSSIVSLDRQQTILDMLRAEPEGSYMFFGPAHCGKTVWTTALYIQNLWLHHIRDGGYRGRSPICRISAKKMLDQHTDYAMRRYEKDEDDSPVAKEPDVSAERIVRLRQIGRTFKLYLEEIDKVKETEAKRSNLFEIINTMYEQQGVLVLNSNLRPEEFAAQFGEDFAWRIGQKCKVINLFDGK
jgi:hypothetical protein